MQQVSLDGFGILLSYYYIIIKDYSTCAVIITSVIKLIFEERAMSLLY